MNWFASFAVLLTITQAPVPVPRQTPNGPTASRGQANTQSKHHDAPPTPSMAVVQPAASPEGKDADEDHTKDNAPHSVIVRELPTVSISKDWADRGVWWFSLCLVIVGAAQAFYVAKTLSAIKEQAKSLKQQNDNYMRRERARIAVEILPVDNEASKMPDVMWGPQFRLLNIGQTPAHNIRMEVSYKVCASVVPEDLGKNSELVTPRVLKANTEDETTRYLPPLMPLEISDILGERKFLHLGGKVTYNIALDDEERETGFQYLWLVLNYKLDDGRDWDLSHWVAHSPSDHST